RHVTFSRTLWKRTGRPTEVLLLLPVMSRAGLVWSTPLAKYCTKLPATSALRAFHLPATVWLFWTIRFRATPAAGLPLSTVMGRRTSFLESGRGLRGSLGARMERKSGIPRTERGRPFRFMR